MRNISLSLLFILLLFSSCYDEFNDTKETTIIDEPEIIVDANLVGEVKNLDDERLVQFTIKINGEEYPSNHGLINLQLEYVNEISQSVYIKTNVGRDAFINLPLLRNDINYAEIFLFPMLTDYKLEAVGNHNIELGDNIRLSIDKNQFPVAPTNEEIHVYHRNLSDTRLANQIGNRAFNQQTLESVLDISHAFHFEWQSSLINDLQLKPGERIELNFESVSGIDNKSLFRYSDEDEYWVWVQDINASNNIITINEDGYYALADHYPAIIARSQLIMDMKPVAYQSLKIETDKENLELFTRTTAMGNWISLVPRSGDLNIQISDACDMFISEFSLPSSEVDMQFDAYELNGLQNNFISINTGVINCEGEEVTNSIITVQESYISNTYIFQNANPDVWISSCDEEMSLFASDEETGESGPAIEWSTNIEDELILLSNCKELEDGFSYIKIRDDRKIFGAFDFSFVSGRTILTSEDGSFRFSFRGDKVRNYDQSEVNIFIEDNTFGKDGYFISCENSAIGCGINDCKVTHYAEKEGDWMRITFSGTMWMQTIDPPVAGNFPIEGLILAKK